MFGAPPGAAAASIRTVVVRKDCRPLCEKFIVMPFKKVRGNIAPGEMRQASNSAAALRLAGAMAERLVGVAAYAVMVNMESGDISSPRVLCQYGEVADLAA
ncbi:hypothetical conserved protein [Rhizobium etli CFN 42]|uniref:Hypothetical conserved protein n=2 Tax=Rhizobium etli TaxID=29449 RepID=Q2K637_RHIEC|nr:hypothetical conserved protein [Rhizobium etli CFN 42]